MLRLASLFLVAALSAALFGFSSLGFSPTLVEMARFTFLGFFLFFLISLIIGIAQQNRKSAQPNSSK